MNFKRGDSFDFSGPVAASLSGTPVSDFTGWSARSQVRDETDTLVANLEVTWLSRAPGVLRLRAPSTGSWPEGELMIDVEFTTPDGIIASTTTEYFTVVRDVTR